MPKKAPHINEVTLLGVAFIRWGLGLFIFGLIIGYAPLVHYLHGALTDMGEKLLSMPRCGSRPLMRCKSARWV